MLTGTHGRSVELRIVSHEADRSILVYLLCISRDDTNDPEALTILGQLLPKDYSWEPLDADGLARALEPPRAVARPWRIGRVVRRLHYNDLPSLLPASNTPTAAPGSPVVPFRLDASALDERRRLPEDPNDFLLQLETRFCLPMLIPMVEQPASDRRSLWEEMQACARPQSSR